MKNQYILDYVALASRVKSSRKLRGLTQETLAIKASISTNFIAKIETNNTTISLQTLIYIANALDVSTDYLLFDQSLQTKSTMDLFIEEMLQGFNVNDKELLIKLMQDIKMHTHNTK